MSKVNCIYVADGHISDFCCSQKDIEQTESELKEIIEFIKTQR